MTVDVASVDLDEAILRKANCASFLLRKPPVSEVTPQLLVELFVAVFGNATELLVERLSQEIGLELDHIDSYDLLRGEKQTTFHFLELFTTYIHYCLDQGLLHIYPSLDGSTQCNDSHLSNSPELPRSVGRPCFPAPYPPSPHGTPIAKNSPEFFQLPSISPGALSSLSSTRLPRKLPSPERNDVIHSKQTSAPLSLPHQFHHRYRSILSMQAEISPPTTPKNVDDFVEIVRETSPLSKSSSLRLSDGNSRPLVNSYPPSSSIIGESQDYPVSPLNDETSPPTDQTKLSDSMCFRPRLTDSTCPVQRHRKISSSSSGRGHSPTCTLTAPMGSPSSSTTGPVDSLQDFGGFQHTDSYVVLKQQTRRKSGKSSKSRVHKAVPQGDHAQEWIQAVNVKSALDDLTSLLSSSIHLSMDDSSVSNDPTECPSASILISKSEGFIKALKERLDYLKTVFCRAHEEAQAVGRLVHAIDMRRSKTVEIMDHCVTQCGNVHDSVSVPFVRESVEKLITSEDRSSSRQSAQCRHHMRHSYPSTTKARRKCAHRQHCASSFPKRSMRALDTEYDELMALKHKLMLDALQACYIALDSHKHHNSSGSRHSCMV